jgi:RHS repeat-associated protein
VARYTQNFAYDNMGRLTQGPQGSYAYTDPAHVHGATSIGGNWSAAYDAAGDMICRAPTDDATCVGPTQTGAQLSYDNTGQLVSWQDRPSRPDVAAGFLYDGQGQRVAQQITDGGDTKLIVYVAGVEEVTTDHGITSTSTFYYANGLRMATAVNGQISYLANDALGSADAALRGGLVTASQLFAPYGAIRFQVGVMPTTFGFTGQRGDTVSGLDYYGARYYDPKAGQFASADNMLEGDGYDLLALSRFAYVTGNPEVRTDSTGHCPWCIAAVVGAAVGAGIAYGTQVANNLQHGQSLGSALTHVDGGEIAKAALVGAVVGATGGLAGGAVAGVLGTTAAASAAGTVASTVIAGAVSGGAGQLTDNLLNGRQWDDNLAEATAEGAVLGPVGHYGGKYLGKGIDTLLGEEVTEDATEQASVCGNSFAGNTLVLMKNGSKKAIKDVRIGDIVKAEDPRTGKTKAERVDATFDNTNPEGWVEVRAGADHLKVTAGHPFWVASKGRFIDAGALTPGDELGMPDGSRLSVHGVTHFHSLAHHYNLTVHQLHTYFVGVRPVLVHNTQCQLEGPWASRRFVAVQEAWALERDLILATGRGTVDWTPEQIDELLNGKGSIDEYQGHHINSVKDFPEFEGDPNNIKFTNNHLAEHGGFFQNQTTGDLISRVIAEGLTE